MAAASSHQQVADRLTAASQAQNVQLRAAMLAGLTTAWRNLGSWHTADVTRFTRLAVPLVRGAQTRMTALTAAYLSRRIAVTTGTPLRQAPAPTHLTGDRLRGVAMTDEYTRPFRTVWSELGAGKDLDTALAAGERRLTNLAATDLQLAKTHTARELLADDTRIVGYRRVLEGPQSCALCVLASTQRYHRGDLMPIHPGCDCSIEPTLGHDDPGQVLDDARLQAAYDALAGTPAKDTDAHQWTAHIVVVHTHGELGPVLTVRGHRFTGPRDVHPTRAAQTGADTAAAQLRSQQSYGSLMDRLTADIAAHRGA